VEGALGHHRRALDLDPFCGLTRVAYVRALEHAGRPDEAIAESRATLEVDDVPWARVWLARAQALTGRRDEARRILAPLASAAVSPVFPALIHAALDERAEALALLGEARARRSPWMAFLRVEPGFDALREERGFSVLQRRMGLAP
jgi:predicted Zn-dependent protease